MEIEGRKLTVGNQKQTSWEGIYMNDISVAINFVLHRLLRRNPKDFTEQIRVL